MNLVALLVAPAVVQLSIGAGADAAMRYSLAAISVAIIVLAVWNSKRKSISITAS
jgi:K(+)-stimulated pyrophosphate-energized sodium pump